MQQEMHPNESENPCRNIIEYDSSAFWKSLQLPYRRRLHDIEGSEKYKTREKSLPSERDGDERDQLYGDFVDYDELSVLGGNGSSHARGARHADQGDECRCRDGD